MEYKIRPPEDPVFGSARTYFTEYDPVVQQRYRGAFVPSHLEAKLKVLSILQDSITVAAAHIVRSETTFEQLKENRRLLEEGVVVPAINAEFSSFEEMVDMKLRLERYSEPWAPNESVSESELFERAKFLDRHSSLLMGWEIDDMRETFRRSLLRDLDDDRSRIRSNLRSGSVDTLRLKIERTEPFSRKEILESTRNLPRPDRSLLYDTMNANYHLAGSAVHAASVNVHGGELLSLGDKFRRGVDATFDDPSIRETFLERYRATPGPLDREDAFEAHLNVLDLGTDDLRGLDVDDVLELRDERVTRKYREKLVTLLDRVNRRTSEIGEVSDLRDELREEIESRRTSERERTRRVKQGVRTSVYTSNVGAYVAGAQELGFTLTFLDPVIRRVVDRLPHLVGNDFLAFEERFTDRLNDDADE